MVGRVGVVCGDCIEHGKWRGFLGTIHAETRDSETDGVTVRSRQAACQSGKK